MNILSAHESRVIDRFMNVMETKLDFAQRAIRLKKQVEMRILSLRVLNNLFLNVRWDTVRFIWHY